MRQVRVVTLGYQGFGNLGDEAILAGVERLLAGTGLVVTHVIAGTQPVAAFRDAHRIRSSRLWPTLAGFRALRRARLLLIVGGGLLHDHWWRVVPTYLAWVVLARLLGLHVAWLGVGVGPLRRRPLRVLAARALAWSHLVTVRDEESARLVAEIAPGVHVQVVPDPAVFSDPISAVSRTDRERVAIGFVVRRPAPGRAQASAPLAAALAGAVVALQRAEVPVQVLTFGGAGDAPFAARVTDAVTTSGGDSPELVALPPDPGAAFQYLARLAALVSVRLHGLILGAMVGTPAVTIAYDSKVTSWATRLGLSDYCLPVENLTSDAILMRLEGVRSPESVERMQRHLDALRRDGENVRDLLVALT